MLHVLPVILAAYPTLTCALHHATSALPAQLDAEDLQAVLDGLQRGGKGLIADEAYAFKEKDVWHPYELTSIGRKWGEYQASLARGISDGSGKKHLKVLVVSAVADTLRERQLLEDSVQRLAATSSGHDDIFQWALFHHDKTTENWDNSTLFTKTTGTGEKLVVFDRKGAGCKLQNWGALPEELTSKYDFIWMMDSDLRLDFFRWDLYRAVLTTLNPLVSQPSVLPPFGGGQSSAIRSLTIHSSCSDGFPVAMELPRTEVQAPVISTKIWPAIRTRIRNGPGTTDWFTDSFWDAIVQTAKDFNCGQVGPVMVNAAPVWHQSWKTLSKKGGGKCPPWKGAGANRRDISSEEYEAVKAALLSIGCQSNMSQTLFNFLFSEQAHEGQRLCRPGVSMCRKWIDGSAKGASPHTCFPQAPEFARTEFAKRGMVTADDTEHLLGGLQVGIYQGLPEKTKRLRPLSRMRQRMQRWQNATERLG